MSGTLCSWKLAPWSAPANLQYIDNHGRYHNQSGQSYFEISNFVGILYLYYIELLSMIMVVCLF